MAQIFSNSPYFDDYNESKNFEKILFKPGRAVQSRELNQIQTIQQKQIERFGNYVFKEGSIVSGCPLNVQVTYSIKIYDTDINGDVVDVSAFVKGCTITGLTSGIKGVVRTAVGGIETSTDTKTIVFEILSYNDSVGSSLRDFILNEQIRVDDEDGAQIATVICLDGTTYRSLGVEVGEGVLYLGGVFVRHENQFVLLSRYDKNFNGAVGVELIETTVTSDDDQTLLDPALGSSNYFAPGADRYKATTLLTTRTLAEIEENDTEEFFTLLTFENGVVSKSLQNPQLNLLLDELAKRTYEESGHYTVVPFTPRVKEHFNNGTNGGVFTANTTPVGNISKLAIGIEPGIAYVNGYRFQNLLTQHLSIDKGIDFISEEQQPVAFNYGNYVYVNEIVGPWDIDNGVQVSLRSSVAQAVTNQTYGTTGAPGSELGTARIKSVVYESGTVGLANAQYRLYLYDVNLTANVPFANVKSIFYDAATGADSLADIVLTSNVALLNESTFNTGVFKFPQSAIKTLRDSLGNLDNSYIFKKNFDVTIATDGTFTVTSAIANEEFPFSAGALNNTQKRDSVVLALKSSVLTANLSGNVSFTSSSNAFSGLGTTFTTQLKAGDRISVEGNVYKIAQVLTNTSLEILGNTGTHVAANVNYQKQFASGELIDLTITGSSGTTRSANLVTDTQMSFDIEESLNSTVDAKIMIDVQRTDGQEAAKVLNEDKYVRIDCSSAGTTGPFNLGFSDVFRIVAIYHGTTYSESNTNVTDQFVLDNGQRDTVYSHGRISLKAGSTLSLSGSSRLLVKLDFFTHSFSSGTGYFSVNSYPVDDTGLTAGTILTEQIPIFSGSSGSFDLRNCIDIRPRLTDTATNTGVIGSSTINPSEPTAISIPSGGLRVPVANEQFLTDLDYYIGRVDRVYVDNNYSFGVDRGVPDLFPNPQDPKAKAMSIALVYIPPYPSLPPDSARKANRFDYSVSTKLIDNRRYTMKDIGNINQRINRIEYYSALNLLETQAKELVVPSDVTGLDRFKNGFLVDAFTGHNIGNVLDPAYKISIDNEARELRPSYLIDNIDVTLNAGLSSHIQTAPRDVTLTVTNASGGFPKFGVVTQGGATGNILQYSTSDGKIYLQEVTGTFSSNVAISSNAGGTATVSNVFVQPSGSLITLPYVSRVCTINPYATKTRNCAEHRVIHYIGDIELQPPYDNWISTNFNDAVVINFDNNYDNFVAIAQAIGTSWRGWDVAGFSGPRSGKLNNEKIIKSTPAPDGGSIQLVDQTYKGIRTRYEQRYGYDIITAPENITYDLGERVVDVSIIPFIRSQTVFFNAQRLMPNIRVYPFFDGENVSQYCAPADGNFGDPLITNSAGQVVGQFNIPDNDTLRFRTGSRIFTLTDDNQNRPNVQTTYAYGTFQASGVMQTKEVTVISTRNTDVKIEQTIQTRQNNESFTWVEQIERYVPPPPSDGGDPVAQTFAINGTSFESGIFVTRIQLYFKTKHPDLPITIEIRETVNGYPGRRSVPFSTKTLYPHDVHVSEDASLATIFTYNTPVYLNPGVEYALVVLPAGNNTGYNMWVSELGGTVLNGEGRVSDQPLMGIFFTSANDTTWSAVQNEDAKIVIYRALFDISSPGTAVLENSNQDFVTISNLNNTFTVGSNVYYSNGLATIVQYDEDGPELTLLKYSNNAIRVRANGTGTIAATSGNATIVGNGTTFTSEVYSNAVIYSANTSTRIGKVLNVISDTVITLTTGSVETISGNAYIIYDEVSAVNNANVRATVENLNSKYVTLFNTNLGVLSILKTNSDWEYKIRDDSSNVVGAYEGFIVNNDYELSSMGRIDSATTEHANYSGAKSLSLKAQLSSSEVWVSPAIDTGRMSSIIVKNVINNDATGEDTNDGNALARYISRQVILDVDQDAEDLKVYLTAYKPPTTDIKVYAKFLNANDGTPFAERGYIELERVTSNLVVSDARFENDYKEFEYKLPASVMTGPLGEVQYTEGGNTYTGYKSFAIKIVLLSPDPAVYPKLKNYRAISVQI